jgi:AraC-like DNA-binding protein
LLFTEAFAENPGRQAALDHLTEYALVLLLRAAKNHLIQGGILMGLADPRLAKAIDAIHQQPAHPWSLESLAQQAGMSRARFAVHFRKTVGLTPFDYLADWRIGVAETLLHKGGSLKIIAPTVGYTSSTRSPASSASASASLPSPGSPKTDRRPYPNVTQAGMA